MKQREIKKDEYEVYTGCINCGRQEKIKSEKGTMILNKECLNCGCKTLFHLEMYNEITKSLLGKLKNPVK